MKVAFLCVIAAAILSDVLGWTALELTNNTVEHPGHCYSKNEKVGAMEKGEEKTIKGECVQVSCEDDTTITYFGCGSIAIDESLKNCKITEEDLTKSYPKCCPDIECT